MANELRMQNDGLSMGMKPHLWVIAIAFFLLAENDEFREPVEPVINNYSQWLSKMWSLIAGGLKLEVH